MSTEAMGLTIVDHKQASSDDRQRVEGEGDEISDQFVFCELSRHGQRFA
jgi:hypothetical protein